ncbi:hypothetical protein VCR14J2_260105 [Vibrio coralliirubri]|nr:hypothetical protein VCR14J2_260105 [Vibrio coralliirubri]
MNRNAWHFSVHYDKHMMCIWTFGVEQPRFSYQTSVSRRKHDKRPTIGKGTL